MHRFSTPLEDSCIDSLHPWRIHASILCTLGGFMHRIIRDHDPIDPDINRIIRCITRSDASFSGRFWTIQTVSLQLMHRYVFDASVLYDASRYLMHHVSQSMHSQSYQNSPIRSHNRCWGIGSTAPFSHVGPLLSLFVCRGCM